jgi:hypothetical protein
MGDLATTLHVIDSEQAGPLGTSRVIVAFGVLLLGGLFLYFLISRALQKRSARRSEELARDANARLSPGDHVVRGRVFDDGEGAAITVEIMQQGREWQNKGRWSHAWREISRKVTVRPFYVVRPSGERVRVEPDERVFLVDKLDGVEPLPDSTARRRTATLKPGEEVYIIGQVASGFDPQQGGYRDAGPALVLRPPRTGRMLISTEPPGVRHHKAARTHRNLAIAAALALAFTHGVLFVRHHMLAFGGHVVAAQIENHSSYKVWRKPKNSRGYWVHHYVIRAKDPESGLSLTDETSYSFYQDVEQGQTVAPFVVAGSFYQIGREPTQSAGKLAIFAIGAIIFALILAAVLAASLPWYLRRRIVETGSGRLSVDTVRLK